MIEFGWIIGGMGIAGLLVYLAACARHRVIPPVDRALEAVGFGGLIAVGLRLLYAAFDAKELCQAVDAQGNPVPGVQLKFGEHTLEIVAGGVGVLFASIHSLIWICRKPSHSHT